MMRQESKSQIKKARRHRLEPMAEGLAEGGKPCGFYSKMDDEELIVYARGEMWQNRINGMREIRRKAPGLYHTLQRRRKRRPGLIEEIGIDRKKREAKDWDGMDRGELIAYAKEFIGGRGISGREELRKEYAVLYGALTRRKLLDAVGLGYVNIRHRDWAAMDKDGLVAFAKKFIASEGIGGRAELEKADSGLYDVLRRRKLLDAVGIKEKQRDWAAMDKDGLVAFAKGFIALEGIMGRKELQKADWGLYRILWKRKLLDAVGLEDKYRDWAAMDKDGLVAFAKGFIAEKGIGGREELKKADRGLYLALLRRKLLDAAFAGVEASKHADAVDGVIAALESFGDAE